jgi:serine protease AprX
VHRGVVWKGPRRWAALTLGVAVGVTPLATGAGAAVAAEPEQSRDKATVAGTLWGDKSTDRTAKDAAGRNDAERDPGALYTVTSAIGARQAWRRKDAAGRAITGKGVTVAVLDSGVAAVPGLDEPGKIVRGPDLSLETNSPTPMAPDTFGHGTHMAGIIAAKDDVAVDPKTGAPRPRDAGEQLGVAPDAQLLALKLATTDGSTDVSQVIAALDWVVQHKDDDGMNVRVVNLAFGTDSVQPYQIDPLAAAAENAWREGLVVVVSGGNGGPDAGGLTNPAIDPYVIAVGAADPQGKVHGWKRPVVASFSSRGTAQRHVDLLAPGRSIVSLRSPGSFVDETRPEGRVIGDRSGRLFRGSGTSQAAAVVSGAAALMLQADPTLTPDQVKAALVRTADGGRRIDRLDGGAGLVDVAEAVEAVDIAKGSTQEDDADDAEDGDDGDREGAKGRPGWLAGASQAFPVATGTGSLDAARGTSHLVDPETGEKLSGEVDVQGGPWDAAAWSRSSATGTAWDGGTWMGARWSGDGWTSTGWSGARWSGARWSGARWSGARWSGARWSGARWSGSAWS